MEPKNLDNYFREITENSEDYYKKQSDEARDYIWRKIHGENKMVMPQFRNRMAVAATILVLLAFSVFFYLNGRHKAAVIGNLQSEIDSLQFHLNHKAELVSAAANYREEKTREIIKEVPVIKREVVEKIRYITDTVYVKQMITEYIPVAIDTVQDKKAIRDLPGDKLTDNVSTKKTAVTETKYFFTGKNKTMKKQREKLFQFRYGSGENFNSHTSALSISAEL